MSAIEPLASILDRLAPDDAAVVARHLSIPSATSLRLWRRDRAVQVAIELLHEPGDLPSRAIERVARGLQGYASKAWLRHRQRLTEPPRNPIDAAFFEIMKQNGGEPLSDSTIYRAAKGSRKR